jgi:hypothetical protein
MLIEQCEGCEFFGKDEVDDDFCKVVSNCIIDITICPEGIAKDLDELDLDENDIN